MEGKGAWIAGGIIGLVLLYYVFKRQNIGSASVIDQSPPLSRLDQLQLFAENLGGMGGNAVARLVGAPPELARPFAQAGRSYVTGTAGAVRQTGTGLNQLVHGDVVNGGKNIVTGAAASAYTATGAKGIVDGLRSIW